jgi:hypothetical protein
MSFFNSKDPSFSAEGYHVARCFSLVQLGTIFIVSKFQNQVRLTFEMPMELRDYSGGRGMAPKQISREYASSFYGSSWLKRHLTQWLGDAAVASLDKKFDPWLILGQTCQIKIEHGKNENTGAWYEIISDIQPLPAQNCPPPFNENRLLTFENFDREIFEKLPDYVIQKIMSSKEYQLMNARNMSA